MAQKIRIDLTFEANDAKDKRTQTQGAGDICADRAEHALGSASLAWRTCSACRHGYDFRIADDDFGGKTCSGW